MPESFDAVIDRRKTYEIRKNDRDFQVGDTLRLRRWDPMTGQYTGEEALVGVTYVTEDEFGLPSDLCVMSIRPSERTGLGEAMSFQSMVDIDFELRRGRRKFPGRRFLLAALTEEVGEVSRALLQRKGHPKVREEAAQVAAVAIRIMEEGDATFDDITDAEAKS